MPTIDRPKVKIHKKIGGDSLENREIAILVHEISYDEEQKIMGSREKMLV